MYDYMKHYQEELIRQYSKSLTLNQLAQIGQYFNQTSLANQFSIPSTSQNPLMNQAHMMNALQSQFAEGLKKKSATETSQTAAYNMQQSLKPVSEKKSLSSAINPRISQTGTNYLPSRAQPMSTQITKSAFTMPVLTTAGSVSAGHKYTNADLSKPKTKTTYSYQQAFLVIIKLKK